MFQKSILPKFIIVLMFLSIQACGSKSDPKPPKKKTLTSEKSENNERIESRKIHTPDNPMKLYRGYYKISSIKYLHYEGNNKNAFKYLLGKVAYVHPATVISKDKKNTIVDFKVFFENGYMIPVAKRNGSFEYHLTLNKRVTHRGNRYKYRFSAMSVSAPLLNDLKDSNTLEWKLSFKGKTRNERKRESKENGEAALVLTRTDSPDLTERPLFISHRGTCSFFGVTTTGIFPCNTLDAFNEALMEGFEGIELDVQLTKDKKFIVAHDSSLRFPTNCKGEIIDKNLEDLLSCEVDRSPLIPNSNIFNKKSKLKTPISSLSEVLENLLPNPQLKKLVIDVKAAESADLLMATEDALSKINIKLYGSKLLFISRSREFLTEISRRFPEAERALEGKFGIEPLYQKDKYLKDDDLSHDVISLNTWMAMNGALPIPLILKLIFSKSKIKNFIARAKEKDLKVLAWTVQSEKHFNFLNKAKADYIITDKPFGRLATYLRKQN